MPETAPPTLRTFQVFPDVPEPLMPGHALQVTDGRHDVPVAEAGVTVHHRERAASLQVDDTGPDGVDGRPVRGRDVDAEVKQPRPRRDARIVEVGANRVRAIERLQRPGVHGYGRTPVGSGSSSAISLSFTSASGSFAVACISVLCRQFPTYSVRSACGFARRMAR